MRSLDLLTKVEIIRQIALGLAHSHSRGIIHRDIKPSNVLVSVVDNKPQIKILDLV